MVGVYVGGAFALILSVALFVMLRRLDRREKRERAEAAAERERGRSGGNSG